MNLFLVLVFLTVTIANVSSQANVEAYAQDSTELEQWGPEGTPEDGEGMVMVRRKRELTPVPTTPTTTPTTTTTTPTTTTTTTTPTTTTPTTTTTTPTTTTTTPTTTTTTPTTTTTTPTTTTTTPTTTTTTPTTTTTTPTTTTTTPTTTTTTPTTTTTTPTTTTTTPTTTTTTPTTTTTTPTTTTTATTTTATTTKTTTKTTPRTTQKPPTKPAQSLILALLQLLGGGRPMNYPLSSVPYLHSILPSRPVIPAQVNPTAALLAALQGRPLWYGYGGRQDAPAPATGNAAAGNMQIPAQLLSGFGNMGNGGKSS